MTSEDLHAIVGRFQRQQADKDLTERQEWLWDAIISELEYRHRQTRPAWQRCSCEFCVPPFPTQP